MGSRRKRLAQQCVYCGAAEAGTIDHVFPKSMFLVEDRHNLPTVSACPACNNTKSQLESYLTAILPFGGLHEKANQTLSTLVPSRLENNEALRSQIRTSMAPAFVQSNGVLNPTFMMPFDADRFAEFLGYVTKALSSLFLEYDATEGDIARVVFVPNDEEKLRLRWILDGPPPLHHQRTLGGDSIVLEGFRRRAGRDLCIWRFRIYGGILLSAGGSRQGKPNYGLAAVGLLGEPDELESTIRTFFWRRSVIAPPLTPPF